jgi:ankyrin repeat protein
MRKVILIFGIIIMGFVCWHVWYTLFETVTGESVNALNNESGYDVLEEAIYKGDLRKVEDILADDYDVNLQNELGETALHFAALWRACCIRSINEWWGRCNNSRSLR